MSGFSGINQFGSLTTQNGTKVDYKYLLEKYDADGNGEISKDEFNTAIKEEKLDKVDIASINKNGDEVVDENEMAVYEQKYKMQEAVNAMSAQITKDFSGTKSKYIAQVTLELTNYITDFAEKYAKDNTDISGMAEAFKTALPTKYTEIKKNALANDPSTFKSKVLDEMVQEFIDTQLTKSTESETTKSSLKSKYAKAIEAEASKYIKANPNCTESELRTHLENFVNQADSDKMKDAANKFQANADALGVYIDSDEIVQLKEYAKEFLTEALNNGITINLGGKNITRSSSGKDNIDSVLKTYTDGEKLKTDMETAIANLSNVSKTESIISQTKTEEAEAVEKNFSKIKGSDYQVNNSLIDYSKVDDRYFNGGEITTSDDKMYFWNYIDPTFTEHPFFKKMRNQSSKQGLELLSSDNIKSQYKTQIESILKEKGIPFDKVASVFENIYNQTALEVINSDGIISIDYDSQNSYFDHHFYTSHINIKTLLDTFNTTFNTNFAKAIDEMNVSNKDMDITDLDFSQASNDENGTTIKDEATGKDLSTLYASGKNISTKDKGSDYYTSTAEKMVERMKSQMLKKAHAMCEANGINFDEKTFESMFNNAKSVAVNTAIRGRGIEANNSVINKNDSKYLNILQKIVLKDSSCTLNVKTLLDTFAENFKTNYTTWVETEANKTKNKK